MLRLKSLIVLIAKSYPRRKQNNARPLSAERRVRSPRGPDACFVACLATQLPLVANKTGNVIVVSRPRTGVPTIYRAGPS